MSPNISILVFCIVLERIKGLIYQYDFSQKAIELALNPCLSRETFIFL